jgi:hypothetical protein
MIVFPVSFSDQSFASTVHLEMLLADEVKHVLSCPCHSPSQSSVDDLVFANGMNLYKYHTASLLSTSFLIAQQALHLQLFFSAHFH